MRFCLALKGMFAAFAALLIFSMIASAQDNAEEPANISTVDNDRLERALEGYSEDETLQTTRPEWTPELQPIRPMESRGGGWLAEALADFFTAIGPLLKALFIILIAVAILYGLYVMFGEGLTLRGRQKDKEASPDVSIIPDLTPEAAQARTLLEDADALAAQGLFAEAVHLLLFRSIDDIQEKRHGTVGRSLTAREIGALGVLPDRVRNALTPIIRIVERSFFGGRDVDEAGWKQARASYHAFAFGEAWT